MPQDKLSMRKIRDVLRCRFEAQLSLEATARALQISKGVVAKYVKLAAAAGIRWPISDELSDHDLEHLLKRQEAFKEPTYVEPDHAQTHQELKKKGITLLLLWEEYQLTAGTRAYQYTSFCNHYRAWAAKLKVSMRQVHRAGEKLFADYAGPKVPVIDASTGEITPVSIFVACLGASSYTFACATPGQTQEDWLTGLSRTMRFIGGVTTLIIPDNPRSLVKNASAYEPELNRVTTEFAQHYGTVILPARPRKPQDKAKVESAVQVVERWILARLRHHRFFSIAEVDAAIARLLPTLNDRPFKKLPGSRREAFERLDRDHLQPLPAKAFVMAHWKHARVNVDYHVELDQHYYSVPYNLVRKEVELCITRGMLEVFIGHQRVAIHARNLHKGHYSTRPEHMPAAHLAHAGWTPAKMIAWATRVGPSAAILVERLLFEKQHPEQAYRAGLGLKRLAREHGNERMDAACARAIVLGSHRYKSVASILKLGLDRQPLPAKQIELPLPHHANLRGPAYYQPTEIDPC
jgi:transposase